MAYSERFDPRRASGEGAARENACDGGAGDGWFTAASFAFLRDGAGNACASGDLRCLYSIIIQDVRRRWDDAMEGMCLCNGVVVFLYCTLDGVSFSRHCEGLKKREDSEVLHRILRWRRVYRNLRFTFFKAFIIFVRTTM